MFIFHKSISCNSPSYKLSVKTHDMNMNKKLESEIEKIKLKTKTINK